MMTFFFNVFIVPQNASLLQCQGIWHFSKSANKSERKRKVKVVLENGNYDKCQPVHGGQGT